VIHFTRSNHFQSWVQPYPRSATANWIYQLKRPEILSATPITAWGEWIRRVDEDGKYCAYGGYLEKRGFYTAEHYVKNPSNVRNLHIGIDIWLPEGTPVFAPLDSTVHSFAYNDKPLDYGGTIILEHREGPLQFYTLYGHLSKASVQGLEVGQFIARGAEFSQLGGRGENGGWYPHLHLQLIKNIGPFSGDYPGVVSEQNENLLSQLPRPHFYGSASILSTREFIKKAIARGLDYCFFTIFFKSGLITEVFLLR
jgi:peptidoglycan LD-endopeptidase LytH